MPQLFPRVAAVLVLVVLSSFGISAEPQRTVDARLQSDLEVVRIFRPAYPFWQHIFTIPDGQVAFGSEEDGRLLATFPAKGNWSLDGRWSDPALAGSVDVSSWPTRLDDRRDLMASRLSSAVGPVLHNPTRGTFLMPNVPRYGPFLTEWGIIYERFGVPADIGLAQAVLESGLNGTARSRANALGLCQWLRRNWQALDRLSPAVIEAYNQTTQAPYCAAYLSILATMYGSFVPALSEHHSGGVNVGRTVINGERLGGADVRQQYFLGSKFARDLRAVDLLGYRDLYRTYGARSFRYAEMVFGNTVNVKRFREEVPQQRVFAMRTSRQIPVAEITKRTRLTVEEIRRFNPALTTRVPANATLYLPELVSEFGRDVSFWHRPPTAAFTEALDSFLQIEAGIERWHQPAFEIVLQEHRERFEATATEEGTVMAAVLGYVINDLRSSRRAAILADFRSNGHIRELFQQGTAELALLITRAQ